MARSKIQGSTLKKVLFLGIAFVIIAAAVVVASNWHAVAALYHPTPTPKPVQLTYTNRQHSFSLKYPQYWEDSEPDGYIASFDSPGVEGCDMPLGVTILYQDLPADLANETLDSHIAKYEESVKTRAPNYTRISLDDITVSGFPAKLLKWHMSNDQSSVTTDQAFFIKDNKVYVITYSAPDEFHNAYIDGFNLIVNTLKFKQSSLATNTPSVTP